MAAQTVLEELTEEDLTREHVQRRVDDWAARIEALYANIERWLPPDWKARRGKPVAMHEDLMQRLGVPRRELPTLEVLSDGNAQIRFRPYGLWIIGWNGRIDLTRDRELFFVLDSAETFEPPSWQIAPA